jgi:hypothetical protein
MGAPGSAILEVVGTNIVVSCFNRRGGSGEILPLPP